MEEERNAHDAAPEPLVISTEEREMLQCKNLWDWLDSEVDIVTGVNQENGDKIIERMTILKYVTILVTKNGFNYNVGTWGIAVDGDAHNPYGVYGLDQQEALRLMNYVSTVIGASVALGYGQENELHEKWFTVNLTERVENVYKGDWEAWKDEILASEDDPRKEWFKEEGDLPPDPNLN